VKNLIQKILRSLMLPQNDKGGGMCHSEGVKRPWESVIPKMAGDGLPRRLRRLAMTSSYGAPGEAQRSGFAGVKEEGGSVVKFSCLHGNEAVRASSDAVTLSEAKSLI